MSTNTTPEQPDHTTSTTTEDGKTTTVKPEVVTTQEGSYPDVTSTQTETAPVLDPITGEVKSEPLATETAPAAAPAYQSDPHAPAVDDGQSKTQSLTEDVPNHVTPGFYDEATNTYCVATGDTLASIATNFYGNAAKSVDIATHNNLNAPVFLGQFLHLPDYTVPGKK